jgi:hypothetical protein
MPTESSFAGQSAFPDEPSPDQRRRFALWRAMASLSQAQATGALSAEQARLLASLADNLKQLAGQMTELAELGRRYTTMLEAQQRSGATPGSPDDSAGEAGTSAVA